jgi:hypothetical protein
MSPFTRLAMVSHTGLSGGTSKVDMPNDACGTDDASVVLIRVTELLEACH